MKSFLKSGLARNTGWMLVGQGLKLIIQALYFTVIARSLGVSNYGAFIGAAALVGVVYPFGTLGSGFLLIKNVARDQTLFPYYWGRALITTAASSSLLFAIVFLLSHFMLPTDIPRRLVLLVSASDLFGLSFITLCGQAFQAFEQLNWTATINVLISTSRLGASAVFVAFYHHPSALQWGYVYFYSTAAVVLVSGVLVTVRLSAPEFPGLRLTKETREGFYFSASFSAQTVYNDIDKTMLARLGSLDTTGIYGAAYRLIEVIVIPITSLRAAAYPNFFRTGADGIEGCLSYGRRPTLAALGYAVLASMAVFALAGIVPYVLGSEYAATVDALRWLAVLPILRTLHYFSSDALSGAGHQGLRASIQVGVAGFNVLINLWLIPAYSWRGAAWSSIGSDALLD